jgi:hypothetical protein
MSLTARLLKTLNAVQTKLQHLEQENGISRRRVRELEMELEVCKRDVARERTRVLEREETIVQQRRDANYIAASKKQKGKARAKDVSMDGELHEKYKEAVEEKKGLFPIRVHDSFSSLPYYLALESLITSLRTHLARLTSELSSHQELLAELRSLRDSDARMLKQKTADIERLKEEVERLAGEVEVLRGVVEEGLRERRAVRDVSAVQSVADVAMSEDLESDLDEAEIGTNQRGVHIAEEEAEEDGDETKDHEAEPFDPQLIHGSSRTNMGAERTTRPDHPMLVSNHLAASTTTGGDRIITSKELERISIEVEERRQAPQIQLRSSSPHTTKRARAATVEDVVDQEASRDADRPHSPLPFNANASSRFATRAHEPPQGSTSRLPVPTSGQTSVHNTRHSKAPHASVIETPFPQIRGPHLERLFFSAPEHNARTCTVCHRQRRRSNTPPPPRRRGMAEDGADDEGHEAENDEDEGFVEGSEEPEHQGTRPKYSNGKRREHVTFAREPGPWRQQAEKEGLPPQTVVARVIRELEDDFTHYKRSVCQFF